MWWRIEELELRPVVLDFQSSGQGKREGRCLRADGTTLVNDVDLADLSSSPCQVIVCDACGTIGCASGNWVVMRRFGSSVVWIPDFGRLRIDEFERSQSWPPEYVGRRGAPMFAGSALAVLQSQVATLSVEALARLNVWEAALLLQWEAPGRVLGPFPDAPRIRQESVLAVDPGEATMRCRELDALLVGASTDAVAELPPADSKAISFYLDLPGTPEWQPIVESRDGRLMLNLGRVDGLGSA